MQNERSLTIITVVKNDVESIEKTLLSVLSQSLQNIEYIVIDGASTDGTYELIKKYENRISILKSSEDKNLYDAINKGIELAGGDYIGLLHSGDTYVNQYTLEEIFKAVHNSSPEIIYSDLVLVSSKTKRIHRYYSGRIFKPYLLRTGYMPPHPTLLINREVIQNVGLYRIDISIAADFEYIMRIFSKKNVAYMYYNKVTIRMSNMGLSNRSYKSKILIYKQIGHILREYNLINLQYLRYFIRIGEYLYPILSRLFRSQNPF